VLDICLLSRAVGTAVPRGESIITTFPIQPEGQLRPEFFLVGMVASGLRRHRHCRECLPALAAQQVVGIEAQQISGTMHEAAMWTWPRRRLNVVAPLPHLCLSDPIGCAMTILQHLSDDSPESARFGLE